MKMNKKWIPGLLNPRSRYCFTITNHTLLKQLKDLDTYFRQRRRWGPSTMVNLFETISNAKQGMVLHKYHF